MPRETFPHLVDRANIAVFLDGGHTRADAVSHIEAGADHKLRFEGDVVAWFDTAGALTVKLLPGWQFHYSRAIIDELMRQVGLPGSCVQEAKELESFGKTIRTMHYYIDDQPLALDEPLVLFGPLGVQAYRASRGIA